MMNCRKATELMSQAQDRPLAFNERLSLRMHLAFCSGCRNFRRQMAFIRKAFGRIGGGSGEPPRK